MYRSGLITLLTSENIDALASYLRSFGLWTPLISLLLLTLETVIPPLPAWPILVANAAIYGLWGGIALSWAGGLLGAIVTFWIARSWGRQYVERKIKPHHLKLIDDMSEKRGFQILLIARVFPLTSLDILSFLAGLSKISFGRFLAATAIGLLPGVGLYTLFAHDLLKVREYFWRLTILVLLSLAAGLLYYYRQPLSRWIRRLPTRRQG